jgi:hypothetical protein
MRLQLRRICLITSLLLLGVLLLPPLTASAAIVIDDFESGPFFLETTFSVVSEEYAAPDALGDARYATTELPATNSTMELVVTDGDDSLNVSTDSYTNRMHWDGLFDGHLKFAPPALGPADLTEAGANDRFRFTFTSVTQEFELLVRVSCNPAICTGELNSPWYLVKAGATSLEVPFSHFPMNADMAVVPVVGFQWKPGPSSLAFSFALTEFAAVGAGPGPGLRVPAGGPLSWLVATLMIAVTGVLGFRSRSRSAAQ